MELHQIRYFLALSEEMNFTRAAARCGVAQSSLTRAIKVLEHELGAPLFHRGRTGTRLTRLGVGIRPFLQRAFTEVESARRKASDFVNARPESLRLGVMNTIAPKQIVELLSASFSNHEDAPLRVTNATAQMLQNKLLTGELDAAIYTLSALAGDERFDATTLYREPFMVAINPAHRLARLEAIRLGDLAGEPYLARSHCELQATDKTVRDAMGPSVYNSDHDDWILTLAAAGVGYALMPARCADHPGVVTRPLIEPPITRELTLVQPRGRSHNDASAIEALIREAQRLWPQLDEISRASPTREFAGALAR